MTSSSDQESLQTPPPPLQSAKIAPHPPVQENPAPVSGAPPTKKETAPCDAAGSGEHITTATPATETQAPKSPLDRGVTLYINVTDTVGEKRTLRQCLRHIRSHATLEKLIRDLRLLFRRAEASRADDDRTAYDQAKKKLPAFTISGTFTKRGSAGLDRYSGIIQVDLDHVTEKGFDLGELKARVSADPHVEFVFDSPSGDGLKCGFLVESRAKDHAEAFLAMQRYFDTTYGIRPDDACKDVSRLCFLSYDPDVFINEQAAPFDWRAWSVADEPEIEVAEDDIDTAVPLPLDAFPAIMRELAQACAEVYRVDVALPAVTAVSVLAAALGKSVRCEGAVSGHWTPANGYTLVGAPPSYGKKAGQIVAAPLILASMELGEHFEKIIRPNLLADIAFAETRKREILSKLKDDDLTGDEKEKLKQEFARLEASVAKWKFEEEQAPAYYTGSFTGAGLGIALRRNEEQMFSFDLDAGDAIRIAGGRYAKDQKGDYDLVLKGYTNEPFAESRASRSGVRLAAPCVNVLWFVQPTLVKEFYGTLEAQERGVLARFNVVQFHHDLVPHDDGIFREVPPEVSKRWNTLVRAALELRKRERKTTFRTEPEAAEIFRHFYNTMADERNGEGREYEAKLLRGRENAIRIALDFAAAEWLEAGADDEAAILTAEHAARGVALAQYFTNQSVNLTRRGAMEKRQARLDEILAIVGEAGGSITLRLLRDNHGVGESELGQIVGRNPGLLKIETAPSGPKGGRRSPRLVIVQKK